MAVGAVKRSAVGYVPHKLVNFLIIGSLGIVCIPPFTNVQIFPLASFIALIMLPFFIYRFTRSPLLKVVVTFCLYTVAHSLVALFIDIVLCGAGQARFLSWFRQIVALSMGFSVFLVLRTTLKSFSDKFVAKLLTFGFMLPLIVSGLNFLWDLTGDTLVGTIVSNIRGVFGLTSWPDRVSGLSLEPAHFAFYLTSVVFPVFLAYFTIIPEQKILVWLLISSALILFIWTKSLSGLVSFLGLIIGGVIIGPWRKRFVSFGLIGLLGIASLLTLFPNSYAASQLHLLFSEKPTVSAIDRFYSTFGPFMKSFSSYVLLGYGLGGTTTHFTEILPSEAASIIATVRWEEMPNLSNLIGRIFAETGLIGFVMFIWILFAAFREAAITLRRKKPASDVALLRAARLAILAFLAGATLGGQGSFALPYVWFWLAIIDSRYSEGAT